MHRILLVDDDADMLMMTGRWLAKEYEVATASSGREALLCLKAVRPELVLLDYYMPELDGPATLAAIREDPATRELPVIFLTGAEEAADAAAAGAQGYLPKSGGRKALLAAIADFFAGV